MTGALDGAAFRLAALASRRFPDGAALDAYLDGDAGLADYLRCGEPRCSWGVAPGSMYCESHKLDRQRAQQRDYKARKAAGATRPSCCDGRRCQQHKQAHDARRGYGNTWAAGARGVRRVAWLYELFGQDGRSWSCRDAAGHLDSSDRGPWEGRTRSTLHPDPWGDEGARQWFAGHAGWVNHPLPDIAPRVKRATVPDPRSDLDRLRQIHRIRRVNGYGPWGENVRVKVRGWCSDAA